MNGCDERLRHYEQLVSALRVGAFPEDMVRGSGFGAETFHYSMARTAEGYGSDLEAVAALLRRTRSLPPPEPVTAILPGNTPAPLIGVTVAAYLAARRLRARPPRAAHAFTAHWLAWAESLLPGLEAEIVADVPAERAAPLVVFGADETVTALTTASDAAVGFGHRFSVAFVDGTCLEAAAEAAAGDIVAWDQAGCLSPGTVFVAGGAVRAFAERLAAALARWEARYPRGRVADATAFAIRTLRLDVSLRETGQVFASPAGTAWSVLVDQEPVLEPSPSGRTVWVRPVEDWNALVSLLQPHGEHLEAVGVAGRTGDHPFAAHVPVRLGEMQSPPLLRRQSGHPAILAQWL